MSSIQMYKGNLLDSKAQVIGHQTNCLGLMGAGVASAIRQKWPEVYEAYAEKCKGQASCPVRLLGQALPVAVGEGRFVVNLFGQCGVRRYAGERVTNYVALEEAMQRTAVWMQANGLTTIAMPYLMGCGLGGGDWTIVEDIIRQVFGKFDVQVELWEL